jgi:hypothetical protein
VVKAQNQVQRVKDEIRKIEEQRNYGLVFGSYDFVDISIDTMSDVLAMAVKRVICFHNKECEDIVDEVKRQLQDERYDLGHMEISIKYEFRDEAIERFVYEVLNKLTQKWGNGHE